MQLALPTTTAHRPHLLLCARIPGEVNPAPHWANCATAPRGVVFQSYFVDASAIEVVRVHAGHGGSQECCVLPLHHVDGD